MDSLQTMTDEDRIARAADAMCESIRDLLAARSVRSMADAIDECEQAADEYDQAVEQFELSDERRRIIVQKVGLN